MRPAPRWPSPTRGRRSASACCRWSRSSARRSSRRPTSRTRRASTRLFARLKKEWGRLDFVVHAIAFSDKEELKGRYVDTTKANFQRSLTISCYSFTEIARRAAAADDRRRQPDHADLRRRHAGDAVLQRHGRGQGGARGQRALSRGRPRPAGRAGQRDLGRADAHPGRRGDRRRALRLSRVARGLAAAPQCRADRRRRRRALFAVRPQRRRHRHGALRRCRLPRHRHAAIDGSAVPSDSGEQ